MISVCMATYNGGKYIKEQLHSILKQLGPEDEVIISDDGSIDDTKKNIKEFNDLRIVLLDNQLEKGYTRNFENAINHAKGSIIFLSDQDDVWHDDKVKIMLKELEIFDFVVSDAIISNSNLIRTQGSHFKLHKVKAGFLVNWIKTRYIGACMAFNKKILERALPFPQNQQLCAHDYWLTVVAEAFYKVKIIHIPLLKYRRHSSNASTGGEKSSNTLLFKIKVRFYTLTQLIKRI